MKTQRGSLGPVEQYSCTDKDIAWDKLPYPGSLGFRWDKFGAAWEDRLSRLADYPKITRALQCSLGLQRKL
jgi:hypothetical protein